MINWFDVFMFLLFLVLFCVSIMLLVLLFDFVAKKISNSHEKVDNKKDNTSAKQNSNKNQK